MFASPNACSGSPSWKGTEPRHHSTDPPGSGRVCRFFSQHHHNSQTEHHLHGIAPGFIFKPGMSGRFQVACYVDDLMAFLLGLTSDYAAIVGTGASSPDVHHRPASVTSVAIWRGSGGHGHLRDQLFLCHHDWMLHSQVYKKVSKLYVCVF